MDAQNKQKFQVHGTVSKADKAKFRGGFESSKTRNLRTNLNPTRPGCANSLDMVKRLSIRFSGDKDVDSMTDGYEGKFHKGNAKKPGGSEKSGKNPKAKKSRRAQVPKRPRP